MIHSAHYNNIMLFFFSQEEWVNAAPAHRKWIKNNQPQEKWPKTESNKAFSNHYNHDNNTLENIRFPVLTYVRWLWNRKSIYKVTGQDQTQCSRNPVQQGPFHSNGVHHKNFVSPTFHIWAWMSLIDRAGPPTCSHHRPAAVCRRTHTHRHTGVSCVSGWEQEHNCFSKVLSDENRHKRSHHWVPWSVCSEPQTWTSPTSKTALRLGGKIHTFHGNTGERFFYVTSWCRTSDDVRRTLVTELVRPSQWVRRLQPKARSEVQSELGWWFHTVSSGGEGHPRLGRFREKWECVWECVSLSVCVCLCVWELVSVGVCVSESLCASVKERVRMCVVY